MRAVTQPAPAVPPTAIPTGAVLLDVREDFEWVAGHAPEALHIPMSELPARVHEIPATDVYVVCRVGNRSQQVAHWLAAQGHSAANVEGGMQAWVASGLPIVSDTDAPPFVV
jgi:rhodanese-related sulfurtransferase